MTDYRIDNLTRQLADLEAEHKALREDHRLLKMKVEEWGSHLELYHAPQEAVCGACHGLLEAHRDAICTKCTQRLAMKDLQECLDACIRDRGQLAAAPLLLQKDEET